MLDDEQLRNQQEENPGFGGIKTIIEMDPPAHRSFRKVASGWFTPRSLARLESAVAESARSRVDSLAAEGDGECDFVDAGGRRAPAAHASQTLGVPREDEPYILRLTNELFSGDDPEFQREGTRQERFAEARPRVLRYFSKIIADRRASPRDDLATVLANASVDGAPMAKSRRSATT